MSDSESKEDEKRTLTLFFGYNQMIVEIEDIERAAGLSLKAVYTEQ